MIAARSPLRGFCPARASTRASKAVVRAQRSPDPPNAEPLAPRVLQTLQTAALVLSVGAHVGVAVQHQAALQHLAAVQQQQQQQQRQGIRRMVQAVPPPATPAPTVPAANMWLTLPLVAALLLGRLRSWIVARISAPSATTTGSSLSTQAAARLVRVEGEVAQQAAALQAATRQLDKLSVRSRLVSRDLKLPLQQLQAAAGQQSEALVGLAQRLEGHDKELRDMEALVEALQGVSAKQFQLLLKVMDQQQQAKQPQKPQANPQQQPNPAQQQPPLPNQSPQQQTARSAVAPGRAPPLPLPQPQPQPSTTVPAASPGGGSGLQQAVSSPRRNFEALPSSASSASAQCTDEWGRRVAPVQIQPPPLPPAAAAQQPASPGSSSSDGPSSSRHSLAGNGGTAAVPGSVTTGGTAAAAERLAVAMAADSLLASLKTGRAAAVVGDTAEGSQPKPAGKAAAEVLPPPFPPPASKPPQPQQLHPPPQQQLQQPQRSPAQPQAREAAQEQEAREVHRRQQMEDWRQRMSRSWQILGSPSAAATAGQGAAPSAAATHKDEAEEGPVRGSGSNCPPEAEAAAADRVGDTAGAGCEAGRESSGAAVSSGGGTQAASSGVVREVHGDGSTTFRFL
ncbi:hypothetical protein ACK3TF_005198 [Chlorella vulgaris]